MRDVSGLKRGEAEAPVLNNRNNLANQKLVLLHL